MTKPPKTMSIRHRRQHDVVTDLHDIWVHCIDCCTPGRETEIDAVFEELGQLRIDLEKMNDAVQMQVRKH